MPRLNLGFPVRPFAFVGLASAALLACANEVSPEEGSASRPEVTGQSQAAVSSTDTWFFADRFSASKDSDAVAIEIISDGPGAAVKVFFCAGSDATAKTHTRWFLGPLTYENGRTGTPWYAVVTSADGSSTALIDFYLWQTPWAFVHNTDRGDGVPVTGWVHYVFPEQDHKAGLYEAGPKAHVGFIYGPSSWGTDDTARGRGAALFSSADLNKVEIVSPIGWVPVDPNTAQQVIVKYPGSGGDVQLPPAGPKQVFASP